MGLLTVIVEGSIGMVKLAAILVTTLVLFVGFLCL